MPVDETVAVQAINVARSLMLLGGAAVVGLLLSLAVARVLFRLKGTDRFAQEASQRCRWPARVTVVLLSMVAALPATTLREELTPLAGRALVIATIIAMTWWAVRLAVAVEVALLAGLDLQVDEVTDWTRRRQTQIGLIRRLAVAVIVLLAIGGILLTFDTARSLGTSLLASAGVLGLVVGIAAQSTLANLVAGVQIAVAEPIKLDDVVVVEDEWGNIEEITLTYVVVRTWDRRRLVLPTSYFVSTPFTNWTRGSSQTVGSVVWYLDHRAPVDLMRAEFHQFVDRHPLWDGDIATLQVVDTDETTIQVRALVTASDSTRGWNLRCEVREVLLAWLRDVHPEALPVRRIMEAASRPMRTRPTVDPRPRPSPGPHTEAAPDPSRTQELPIPPKRRGQ